MTTSRLKLLGISLPMIAIEMARIARLFRFAFTSTAWRSYIKTSSRTEDTRLSQEEGNGVRVAAPSAHSFSRPASFHRIWQVETGHSRISSSHTKAQSPLEVDEGQSLAEKDRLLDCQPQSRLPTPQTGGSTRVCGP